MRWAHITAEASLKSLQKLVKTMSRPRSLSKPHLPTPAASPTWICLRKGRSGKTYARRLKSGAGAGSSRHSVADLLPLETDEVSATVLHASVRTRPGVAELQDREQPWLQQSVTTTVG